MLNQFDRLPEGLLDASVEDLKQLLGMPTLIHLEGNNKQPLFVSTLLHGNETTGFYALQKILRHYQDKTLPRSLSIFIGNVDAAAVNQRRLDNQPDYNRIWPGTHHSQCEETDIMATVTSIMRKRKPFASIDIHNNTGRNPHYACVNILNPHGLQLAAMFGKLTVYFTNPKGVQSTAFSDFCPSVVLECGQSSDNTGVDHAAGFLQKVLVLEHIPGGNPDNLNLFHTVARVTVPRQFSIGIDGDVDVRLKTELEDLNFSELNHGYVFAGIKPGSNAQLLVNNESDEDVTHEFFECVDDTLVLQRKVTLSMYTNDERAIRQDCLCYLMEQLHINA
ncbi:MAG: M14 family metallopeptidase [Gammaproteobacteria bacterium]